MSKHTIDLTPSWSQVAKIILLALEKGTEEGKAIARQELFKMAKVADLYVESLGDSSPEEFVGLVPESYDENNRGQDI